MSPQLASEYLREKAKRAGGASADGRGVLQKSFDFIQRPMYANIGALQAHAEEAPKGEASRRWLAGIKGLERPTGADLSDTLQQYVNKYPERAIPLLMPSPQYATDIPAEGAAGYNFASLMSLPQEERGEKIRKLLEKAKTTGRAGDVGWGMARGFKEGAGEALRGLAFEFGLDPLTYVTLGASAEGQAIAKGMQRSGKALGTGERLLRSAKLGGKLLGRKGIGGVNFAGRTVLPFPAISEAARAAKLPQAVAKIKALPGVDDIGRALKPFWNMTGLQKKQGRLYLWGKEMKKREFEEMVLKRAKDVGLTKEQAELATHGIQYHELLEGDDPVKALDNALVKWAGEGKKMRLREQGLKGMLGIKVEKGEAALRKTTGEIADMERRVQVATGARRKAATARKELAALDKREELAGIDRQINRVIGEMDALTYGKKEIHRAALGIRKTAQEATRGSRPLIDVVRRQFKGGIRINRPKALFVGAEGDAWSKLPSSWKATKGGGIDIDELVELVAAEIPGYAESHGGIVNSLDFVEELLESHAKSKGPRVSDFYHDAERQLTEYAEQELPRLEKSIESLFEARKGAGGVVEEYPLTKPSPFERIVIERGDAAAHALAKAKRAPSRVIPKLEELKARKAQIEQMLVLGGTKQQRVAWRAEAKELGKRLETHKGLFETPETEIREFAERLAQESPEARQKIKESSFFGQEQFEEMLAREQAAGLPVQKRERYAPGFYPKEITRRGGSSQRQKTFASLLEAKSAGYEPEMNMWKLIAERGHKSISASETRLFTDDMIRKFGTRLAPDDAGKVTLKEGERIWAQRDALRNLPAADVPGWVYKRIDDAGEGAGLIELRLDDVHALAKMSKETPIYSLPEPLVNWMNTYEKRIKGENLRTFAKWNSRFMNYFRAYATMPRPAFHIRNAVDNYWRLFLDLGPAALSPKWNVTASKVLWKESKGSIKLHGKTYSYGQIRQLMEKHGLRRHGWIGGDVWKENYADVPRALNNMFEGKGKRIAKAFNPLDIEEFGLLRAGRYFGEHIEDHAHAVSFMKNLDTMGDPYKAAERTHKFLIDYRELTPFERRVGKGLFPFYTFFRKNIPLQVEQMAKQPGKYALIPKGKRFIENLSEEPDYDTPEYYDKAYAIRLPLVRRAKDPLTGKMKEMQQYANLNMSFQEMNQLSSLSDIIARGHPLLKAGFELFAEKEAFSDIPGSLAEGKMVRAPGAVAALPKSLREGLSIYKIRRRGGEVQWVMPAKARYLVQTLNPYAAELGKIALPPGLEGRKGWGVDFKRFLTGAMTTELDPDRQRRYSIYNKRRERRERLQKLRQKAARID